MATATLKSVADLFGVGASVGAYVPSGIPGSSPISGAAVTTAVVQSDGSLTFTGLADSTNYVAYLDATHYRRFNTAVTQAGEPVAGPPVLASGSPYSVSTSVAVADNTVKMQAAIDVAQALGRPLDLRDLKGTLRLNQAGGDGLKVRPGLGGLKILGPGKNVLTILLSRNNPRFLDLDPGGLNSQVFSGLDVGGFTIDAANLDHLAMAPVATVAADVTLAGSDAYTTVTLDSNANFQTANLRVWALPGNVGNPGTAPAAAGLNLFARPVAGSGTDIQIRSSIARTLKAGDQLSGSLDDHIIIGNRVNSRMGALANGSPLTSIVMDDLYVHDIEVINAPATQVASLTAPSPSKRYGIALQGYGAGSSLTNVRTQRVRVNGADCGFWYVGGSGAWIDKVDFEDNFYDRGTPATANYPSLAYMVGQNAWVGSVTGRRNVGRNSGDVGLEIDNAMYVDWDETNLIEDSFSFDQYYSTFAAPASSAAGPPTTTLSADITNAVTAMTTGTIPAKIATTGYLLIDSEVMQYDVTAAGAIKIRRGFNGSAAAAHTAGATITFIELHRQRISMRGRTRRVSSTTSRHFGALRSGNLPFPKFEIGGTREALNDTAVVGEGCYVSGFTPEIAFADGYEVVANGNTATEATLIYATCPSDLHAFYTEGGPTKIRGKARLRAGGIASGGSLNFAKFDAGWWDLGATKDDRLFLDIENSRKPSVAGTQRGLNTSAVANTIQGAMGFRVFNSDQADGAFVPANITGSTANGGVGWDMDLRAMKVSTGAGNPNYAPWLASDGTVVFPGEILHPIDVGVNGYTNKPEHWSGVVSAASFSPTHAYDVVPMDTAAAAGAQTVLLPAALGGNAASRPLPGTGGKVRIVDVTGAAGAKNVLVGLQNATDKLNGVTNGTVTAIATNLKAAVFVCHGSLGWFGPF